jgi:hypothetical protein
MSDPNEIAALKASFRGAISTATALAALENRMQNLDPAVGIGADDLEELARVTAAHAMASAALRGLVATMVTRRKPLTDDGPVR